jgi:hypothetical protein
MLINMNELYLERSGKSNIAVVEQDPDSTTGKVFIEHVIRESIAALGIDEVLFDNKRTDSNFSDLQSISDNVMAGNLKVRVEDFETISRQSDLLFIVAGPLDPYAYYPQPEIEDIGDYVRNFIQFFEELKPALVGYAGLVCIVSGYATTLLNALNAYDHIEQTGLEQDQLVGFAHLQQMRLTEEVKKKLDELFPSGYHIQGQPYAIGVDMIPPTAILSNCIVNGQKLSEMEIFSEDELDKLMKDIHEYKMGVLLNKDYPEREKIIASALEPILWSILKGVDIIADRTQRLCREAAMYIDSPEAPTSYKEQGEDILVMGVGEHKKAISSLAKSYMCIMKDKSL